MADAGQQAPGVPAPQAPQAPQWQQPTQEVKHVPQLHGSHFKPEFLWKKRGCTDTSTQNEWLDGHTSISWRCKSPKTLPNISERGKIMVWAPKTYKCRLARLSKSIQTAVFKNRKHKRTIILHVAIISFWWKYRNIKFIHNVHKTGSYTFRLWTTTKSRSIQNTLSTKLYWLLFPIENLRWAVETAKRILTKEKTDRQLAGQSSSTPFMSIKDSYNNKKVTFDTQKGIEDKIDRLTVMIIKLAANDEGTNKQFKSQIYQSKRRGQTRNFYDKCNYDQINYQNRYRSNSWDKRLQFSCRIQYRQNYRGRWSYEQGITLEEEILEVMQECIKIRNLE